MGVSHSTLQRQALSVEAVLKERLFPDRERLGEWVSGCYFGGIPTRAIQRGWVHRAQYAV